MVSKRQRLEAALAGEIADRPPVALWRHFPVEDQTVAGLVTATLAFQESYDFDFVKVTPASSFCLKDWGSQDEWQGADEGTRAYTHRVILGMDDWSTLPRLAVRDGWLGDQLKVLQELRRSLGDEVPIIQTVFSPLAQAKNLAGGDRLMAHLRRDPSAVAAALQLIADVTAAFVEAAFETGIDGVFYAIQHASYRFFDLETYRSIALPLDLAILEAASSFWLNVLHLHGDELIFDLAAELPAHVLNWHDRRAGPPLAEGAQVFDGAVCGGLERRGTMVLGDPEQVRREALEGLASTEGRGTILGAGCVVPIIAPPANLRAARAAVDSFA